MMPEILRISLRLFILAIFAFALPDASFAQGEVRPILNCISYVPERNEIVAYFGYISSRTTPVTIEVGAQNFFSPGLFSRNQPTVFEPGIHDRVFFTSFQISAAQTQVTWFLNGNTAVATHEPNLLCNLPRYVGDWHASGQYQAGDLVKHNGFLWVLPLTADGNIEPSIGWRIWPGPVPGPQGPKGLNWKGEWNQAEAYLTDDAVSHNGSSWIARRENTNVAPSEGDDWSLVALKGNTGPQGIQGPQGLQGLKGDKGDTGPQGPAGVSALLGATTVNASTPINGSDTATAQCPAAHSILTGGGECARGSLLANGPVGSTQWRVKCSGGGVTARAICIPLP